MAAAIQLAVPLSSALLVCQDGNTLSQITSGTILSGSTNLGGSWIDQSRVMCAVRKSGHVHTRTVVQSLDNGVTWQAPYPDIPDLNDIWDLLRTPDGSIVVLINSTNPVTLFRLAAGASAWVRIDIARTGTSEHLVRREANGELYLCIENLPSNGAGTGAIFNSTDNGQTWALLFNRGGAATGKAGWDIPREKDIGFAWQNQDAGATTTVDQFPNPDSVTGAVTVINVAEASMSNRYAGHICTRADGSLLCMTNAQVRRSTDGGATWSILVAAPGTVNGLAPRPTSTGRIFCATTTDFFKSDDSGATWTSTGGGIGPSTAGPTTFRMQQAFGSGGMNHKTRSAGDRGRSGIPSGLRFPRYVDSLWGPYYGPKI